MRAALSKATETEKALADKTNEITALQARVRLLGEAEAQVAQLANQVQELKEQLDTVSGPEKRLLAARCRKTDPSLGAKQSLSPQSFISSSSLARRKRRQ